MALVSALTSVTLVTTAPKFNPKSNGLEFLFNNDRFSSCDHDIHANHTEPTYTTETKKLFYIVISIEIKLI